MDRTHRLICVCFVDQGSDADFRGGNHLGIDSCIGAPNILAATPEWERTPAPMTEIFATFSS